MQHARLGAMTNAESKDGRQTRPVPIAQQPVWCLAAWGLLGSLLVWSYGANNVPFPSPGGLRVPLADVVLVVLLVRSRRWWIPWTRTRPGSIFLLLLIFLGAFSLGRAIADAPEHGIQAFRGALFALEAWSVMLGVALARRLGRPTIIRTLSILFGVALAWFMLYPLRDQVIRLSPTVGVQRPAQLFAFTSMGLVAGWALFWFAARRSLLSLVATIPAVAALLFIQARGVYAGLAVAVVVVVFASRVASDSRLLRRLVIAAAAGVIVLSLLPPLPGRLGVVSFETLVDAARTAIGQEGEVMSSFDDRQRWIDTTVESIRAAENGWIFGVGFGEDLTGGFGTSDGAVIKPHNDLLEFYARLGLFVVPWILLWVVTFQSLWKGARTGDELARWGLAALVLMVAVSLTQPINSFAYGGLVWWMLAGGILGNASLVGSEQRERSPLSQGP